MSQERPDVPQTTSSPSPAPEQRQWRPSPPASPTPQSDYDSDGGQSGTGSSPPQQRPAGSGRSKRRGGNLHNLDGATEDTSKALQRTGGKAESVIGDGNPPAGENKPKNDALKLRLDLNLDVWIDIKAKVHGDVTLSLLE